MSHRTKKKRQPDNRESGRDKGAVRGAADRRDLPEVTLPSSVRFWTHTTYKVAAVCGFLLLAVALVFGQTIGHEFINFDDNLYVYENPVVQRGLTLQGFRWAFTTFHANNWHPLTWFSHMLDCTLYGLQAGGHHLTSVFLHASTVVLLFLVLWRMTGFLWRSAFVAAVFAIHPLRAESVAWVAERKDVLSGLFFMLTLGAYVRYVRRPTSMVRYGVVVLIYAGGLMTKPMLVTLPFVLLLLDYWPLGRMGPTADKASSFPWRVIVDKFPLLALTAASCAVTFFAQGDAIAPIDAIPISSRVANALVSYMAYIGDLFYPVGLAVIYPLRGDGVPIGKAIASTLALMGISTATLVWRRQFPYLFVGWFWYLGMLVPVIGLLQVGSQSMADRYTYLPQIGLCLAVTWGGAQLAASWRRHRWVCIAVSVLAVLILMGFAWRQTSYWRNSETLWTHALDCDIRNYKAHGSLGAALVAKGQNDAAIVHFQKALEITPKYAMAHLNIGHIMAVRGQNDAAIAHFQKALEINPVNAEAHLNLGVALKRRGQVDAAIAHYRKALEIEPNYAIAYLYIGYIMAEQGQNDAAIANFQKALEINPVSAEAYFNLGVALQKRGQNDAAIVHFQKALEIKPTYADARFRLGVALERSGQVDAAITQYRRVLEIRPDYAGAYNNLGTIMAERGQFDAAIAHFQKALEIKPDDANVRDNLDLALKSRGRSAGSR